MNDGQRKEPRAGFEGRVRVPVHVKLSVLAVYDVLQLYKRSIAAAEKVVEAAQKKLAEQIGYRTKVLADQAAAWLEVCALYNLDPEIPSGMYTWQPDGEVFLPGFEAKEIGEPEEGQGDGNGEEADKD